MTHLRRLLLIAFVATLTTAGLLVAPSVAGTPATYHQSDSFKTVTVKKGDTIKVSLRTAADGGYSWAIVQGRNSTTFTVVSKKVETINPGVPGSPARTVFTLKATARGTATFKAVERRPFNKSNVIRRFTLYLHVVKR